MTRSGFLSLFAFISTITACANIPLIDPQTASNPEACEYWLAEQKRVGPVFTTHEIEYKIDQNCYPEKQGKLPAIVTLNAKEKADNEGQDATADSVPAVATPAD